VCYTPECVGGHLGGFFMGKRIVKTLKVGKYYKLKPLFNIKPMKNYDGILLKTEFDWWCTEKIKTSHS
jgi:hypothetical protein